MFFREVDFHTSFLGTIDFDLPLLSTVLRKLHKRQEALMEEKTKKVNGCFEKLHLLENKGKSGFQLLFAPRPAKMGQYKNVLKMILFESKQSDKCGFPSGYFKTN